MKTFGALSSLALFVLPLACSDSADNPALLGSGGGGASGAGTSIGEAGSAPGGGGETASAGATNEGVDPAIPRAGQAGNAGSGGMAAAVTSTLPLLPAAGVPRPAGTAGGLTVLDWAGFQAAVTYTFDDATTSQIASYDALQALGVPLSFYLWTSMGGAMSDVWERAVADGHEIGNHTHTHQMGTSPNLDVDTDAATTFIESRLGVTVRTMAAPFGHTQYAEVARTRFLMNRGTGGGQVAPNGGTDRFNLPTFIPPMDAPASAFNVRLDMARTAGSWETVLVHGFSGGNDGAYLPVAIEELVAAVEYAKSFDDVWIGTLLDVGAYWIAQKLLTDATPSTNGDTTTWSWTLPDHFPPGHGVRVTVNGGTLSQAGTPLEWNEGGYYEVALDAGSLTLTP